MSTATPDAPLAGIRVLEVGNWLAVPATAALMADLGADVVKVEPPSGDPWRNFRMESMGYSGSFPINYPYELDNRGKRGLTLDLEQPEGRATALRLATQCDVFMTNLIPSRRERYGLTYRAVSEGNPRVVYLGFSGYGTEGPDKDRLGFDYAAFWARSGIMGLVGEPDTAPALQRAGMGDHSTAGLLLSGVLAALFQRERSGSGQEINGSLLNTGIWVLGSDVQAALVARQAPARRTRTEAVNPIWNSYRSSDGRWLLLVMPTPDPYWPRMCTVLDKPEWGADPRFVTLAGRAEHSREIIAEMDAIFATATRDEWAQRLDAQGVIWAPAQSIDAVITDPQAAANHFFTTVEHPTHGPYQIIDTPIKFGGASVGARGPAPELGQHTEEVLLEAGYTWEEIAALREHGALG